MVRFLLGNLKVLKQPAGITAFVIVGGEHLGSHGFTKSAGAAHTNETFALTNPAIHEIDQSPFHLSYRSFILFYHLKPVGDLRICKFVICLAGMKQTCYNNTINLE